MNLVKNNVLKVFKPSWKKVIATILLSVLTVAVVYRLMAIMVGCVMDWGCDKLPFGDTIISFLAVILIAPVYYFLGIFQIFFRQEYEVLFKGNIWYFIFGFSEIFYLYFLVCIVAHIRSELKKW